VLDLGSPQLDRSAPETGPFSVVVTRAPRLGLALAESIVPLCNPLPPLPPISSSLRRWGGPTESSPTLTARSPGPRFGPVRRRRHARQRDGRTRPRGRPDRP